MKVWIFLMSLISSYAITKFTYKSCGDTKDIAQNVMISIDPSLPQTDYTLYLSGDFSKEVKGGLSKYNAIYNGLPVSQSSNDLCEELKNSNTSCPISSGFYSSQSKGTVPSGLTGKVVLTNEWFNQDNERILCMSFAITS